MKVKHLFCYTTIEINPLTDTCSVTKQVEAKMLGLFRYLAYFSLKNSKKKIFWRVFQTSQSYLHDIILIPTSTCISINQPANAKIWNCVHLTSIIKW